MALSTIYWHAELFWPGKLVDHPEITSQGETLEELHQSLRDAWREMTRDDLAPIP